MEGWILPEFSEFTASQSQSQQLCSLSCRHRCANSAVWTGNVCPWIYGHCPQFVTCRFFMAENTVCPLCSRHETATDAHSVRKAGLSARMWLQLPQCSSRDNDLEWFSLMLMTTMGWIWGRDGRNHPSASPYFTASNLAALQRVQSEALSSDLFLRSLCSW